MSNIEKETLVDTAKNSNKIKATKMVLGWWVVATIVLGGLFFAFYGDNTDWVSKGLLTLGGSSLVLGIILFETKVHLSLPLIFISELCHFGASLYIQNEEININTDLLLAAIGVFSGIYFIVKALRKADEDINIPNIIKKKIEPFNVPLIVKLILLACMVSAVFTLANIYRATLESVTWVSVLYVLMPTFIILLSVIPLKETVYLRIVFYFMWIILIQMASEIGTASMISMTEPIVYLISVIFGRLYLIGNTIKE